GITIKCYYPSCEQKYRLANSFSSHISKVHKKDKVLKLAQLNYNDNNDSSEVQSFNLFTTNNYNSVDEQFFPEQFEKDNHYHEEKNNSDENFLMNLAHFLFKLKFKFCLPASTNNLLKHLLQELNLSAGSIEDILDNVLDKTFNTVDDNLGTIYKRKKFYEKNFPYVSPIQIPLNNSSSKKKQFFHYVPLKGTIKLNNYMIINH
ncbi:GSCOCG00012064001-RA-CDS, partial [Cotesia congregata]